MTDNSPAKEIKLSDRVGTIPGNAQFNVRSAAPGSNDDEVTLNVRKLTAVEYTLK